MSEKKDENDRNEKARSGESAASKNVVTETVGGEAAAQKPLRVARKSPIVIHSQYMKDLSFENPNAPHTLKPAKNSKPVVDVSFSLDAQKTDVLGPDIDNAYEVVLSVRVQAKKDDMIAFLVEVEYGLVATLEGVPEDQIHPLLMIEMPHYIFPFLRQTVAAVTQEGGYAPLLLAPADFRAFYLHKFGSGKKAPSENAA